MQKLLLVFLMLGATLTSAQRNDKIKAYKTAYITEALELTSTEAEKFWPIYNAHEEKLHELRIQERKEIFEILKGDFNALSDAEANILLDKAISLKEKEFLYRKDLAQQLKAVLPAKKILKLKIAEEDFKRTLLDKMKSRREQKPRN
ncbi:MAG: sensor of ECF-type sigma factor [Flavobacteriaceae bacterium]|nr:sensor of ECF-type sigma factor [Flavobacteriaceae bacterium]